MTPETPGRSMPLLVGARGASVLAGIVLTLLLALHFLSQRDTAGDHRPELAITAVSAPDLAVNVGETVMPSASVSATLSDVDSGGDTHQIAAGCALLLTAVILLWLRRPLLSTPDSDESVATSTHSTRGSPAARPRLALCVTRV